MSLADLFSPSFLMYLGIMVLAIAVLVVYFESKMREQNHKIASMFSIVSTLAEDNNQLKFAVGHMVGQGGGGPVLEENIRPFFMQENNQLIEVSDDEEESDEEEEEEDEEEDESEVDDSDSDSDDEDEEENSNVKVLKISSEKEEDNMELDELDELEDDDESSLELGEQPLLEEATLETIGDKKVLHIDLEEVNESEEAVDYKKLTLQKLKSVVVEKGLVADASKLKKPELLKLLGIE
jgi:flagellar biosynthesis GTPase FlhF